MPSNDAAALDWSDPARLVDPHPGYQRLIASGGLVWGDAIGGWLASSYAQVVQLLRDDTLSAAGPRAFMAMLPPQDAAELAPLADFYGSWMVFSDDPHHSSVRSRLLRDWSARAVERWRPATQAAVANAFAALDGDFDGVSDLTRPLSNAIISDVLDIPAQDRATVDEWSRRIIAFIITPQPVAELGREALAAARELEEYAWHAAQQPGHVLAPVADLGRLTVAATMAQLLTGGTDPLSAALASHVHAVLSTPAPERELLAGVPARRAVHESLRLSCPFTLAPRVAREPLVVGDERVEAGQMINVMIAAANRDGSVFEEPDTWVTERATDEPHLSFGLGSHYCLGSSFARLVMEEFHTSLLTHVPRLELVGEVRWIPAFGIRSLSSLPLRMEPVAG